MSRISTSAPLLLISFVFLCGCQHRPPVDRYATDNMYHWMAWEVYEAVAENPVFDMEQTLAIIYDESEEDSWRRNSVFDVFENRVRPGWTSRDFGALLKEPGWIEGAQIMHVFALGGFIAVDLPDDDNETDLVFTFIPFAKNRGADPGSIIICLGGLNQQFGFTNEAEAVELVNAFLRGDLESDKVYLVEFAMSHPDRLSGCIERFTQRGHGLMPWR